MRLQNSVMRMFIKPNLFILLIYSKYPVGQEDKNRTCPVPSCYIALPEEPLRNDALNIASIIYFLRLSPGIGIKLNIILRRSPIIPP